MFERDTWSEIYHVLSKNKIRTGLTAFGVLWGMYMLLVMLGSGQGLKSGINSGFADFATNSFFIWPQNTTIPYAGFPKGRFTQLTNDDTKAIIRNVKGVDLISPRINSRFTSGSNTAVYKEKSGVYNVMGELPQYNEIDPANFLFGRYINEADNYENRKVIVIGKVVHEQLFGAEVNPVGEYIKLNGAYFKVIGVFSSKHSGGWANWQNQLVIMPFQTMQRYYNLGDKLHFYAVTVKPGFVATEVMKEVRLLLAKRHQISPEDELAFGSNNMQERFSQMTGLMAGIDGLIWIVGIMTLLAGAIGISNIMLIVVKERTKEIGIKRALGATPKIITRQILLESLTLTTVAGSIGLLLSVVTVEFIRKLSDGASSEGETMFKNPQIAFGTAIAALIIIMICGLFAGLIPAFRATKIKPIEALKD